MLKRILVKRLGSGLLFGKIMTGEKTDVEYQ